MSAISRPMKCFVAMAFDRDDTDRIYDRAIRPCLKGLSMKPVRIDREEHNDDIDDKIIQELEEASFVIADLTYARPSVYFEAGYAQRKIPVIYTCRSDHFRPKSDDKYGNFRVHFDLQMKNIIGWKDGAYEAFSRRLSKRITKVVTPMLREQEKSDKGNEDARQFASLSLRSQREAIENVLATELGAAGYEGNAYVDAQGNHAGWYGIIQLGEKLLSASAVAPRNNSAQELQSIVFRDSPHAIGSELERRFKGSRRKESRSIIQDIFICAASDIPHLRIASAFPHFSYDRNRDWFFGSAPIALGGLLGYKTTQVRLHVIDKTSSLSSLHNALKARLQAISVAEIETKY